MSHLFTEQINKVLEKHFQSFGAAIFELSPLLQYINKKTRSANSGSKARGSFANLYALYVLIEDYLNQNFHKTGKYSKYQGADYSPLLQRVRNFPFGAKLQNHALNNRANDEFHKYFPQEERRPIMRNVKSQKYWINEALLIIEIGKQKYNIAESVIVIIDLYIKTKRHSFQQFITDCEKLKFLDKNRSEKTADFIRSMLTPERDARLFEIISYAVLRAHFAQEVIFIGLTQKTVTAKALELFKTGRTNANDGGIDFVMCPLGRFFQVTETLDVKKYFLDIDKIERFPMSFVIKTTLSIEEIRERLKQGAIEQYGITEIVSKNKNRHVHPVNHV